MDLCLALEQGPGSRVTKRWWEKDGLDVEGMQMVAWEAEQTEGGGGGRTGYIWIRIKSLGG